MKRTNKQLLGFAVATALAIGAAGGALARGNCGPGYGYGPGYGPGWGGQSQMMGGPGCGYRPHHGPARMGGRFGAVYSPQQLDQLKSTLGITAEQEGAWSAYADAVKGKADLVAAHRQARFDAQGVTPEQRLSFRQEGLAQMQKVVDATRDLYAVLTPEQQARTTGLIGPRCAAW